MGTTRRLEDLSCSLVLPPSSCVAWSSASAFLGVFMCEMGMMRAHNGQSTGLVLAPPGARSGSSSGPQCPNFSIIAMLSRSLVFPMRL